MPPDPAASPPPGRRLLLLRHAKAVPHDDRATDPNHDHGRDLAFPRAPEQLASVSAFLRARALDPDLVLLSDSRRTRRTWELLAPLRPHPPRVEPSPRLYLAEAAELLSVLRAAPDHARTLLLVGHNPGLHALLLALLGRPRARACHLADGMPTATLAVLGVSDLPWSQLAPAAITDCVSHIP